MGSSQEGRGGGTGRSLRSLLGVEERAPAQQGYTGQRVVGNQRGGLGRGGLGRALSSQDPEEPSTAQGPRESVTSS